jgi:hypothetical protein
MTTNSSNIESICCPKFDPTPWDDRTVEWHEKKFIRDKVRTVFFMPLNFGKVMKRLDDIVSRGGAENLDHLCLSEHTSKWNQDVYMAVNKEIPDTQNTLLSGKFYSKVYEGNFKDTGKWSVDFEKHLKVKGYGCKRMFMWYTTCPKCAKKYGKNYVVILALV